MGFSRNFWNVTYLHLVFVSNEIVLSDKPKLELFFQVYAWLKVETERLD